MNLNDNAGMQQTMEMWSKDPILSPEDKKKAETGLVSPYEIFQAYKEDLSKVQAQEVTVARMVTEAAGGKHTDDDTYAILKKQGIHDVTLTQGPLAQMFFPSTDTNEATIKIEGLRDTFIKNNDMTKAFSTQHSITPEEILAVMEREGLKDKSIQNNSAANVFPQHSITPEELLTIIEREGLKDKSIQNNSAAKVFPQHSITPEEILSVIEREGLSDKSIQNNSAANVFPQHSITPEELLIIIEREGLGHTVGKQLNLPSAAAKVAGLRDKFITDTTTKDKDFGIK